MTGTAWAWTAWEKWRSWMSLWCWVPLEQKSLSRVSPHMKREHASNKEGPNLAKQMTFFCVCGAFDHCQMAWGKEYDRKEVSTRRRWEEQCYVEFVTGLGLIFTSLPETARAWKATRLQQEHPPGGCVYPLVAWLNFWRLPTTPNET